MSTEVNVSFAQKFRGDFMLLSQQMGSRFRGLVRDDPDSLNGKFGHFNRIGATEMQERTNRHADTPLVSTPHSRRRVSMKDWEWADLIDRQDLHRLLSNPQNAYVRNATAAARRNTDKVILEAANGDAVSMDADEASSTVALPAAQKIAAVGNGMTIDKIIEAREILSLADVDEMEPVGFAISPKQATDMLGITEFKSADFNGNRPLANGLPMTFSFAGFNFIQTNLLSTDGSSNRLCLAWAASGLGFALGEELFVDIGPRRDKSMATQVYVAQTMGATRIEDAKVVEIACAES